MMCCSSAGRPHLSSRLGVYPEVSVDQDRFDQLAVAFARGTQRRTLLRVLSGALLSAGLLAAPVAEGKGQGTHHKGTAAKRRHAKPKQHKKTKAAACPLCKRLDSQGRCVADLRVNGKCCTRAGGQSGRCLAGLCLPAPCTGPICNDQTCSTGCCDAQASCHIDDADACGTGGETCTACDVAGDVCSGGACVCELGTSCTPPDGDTDQATCHAAGRCCVASGGDSGGVPGQSCFAANCCSGACRSVATGTICF